MGDRLDMLTRPAFLDGAGACGELIASLDWSRTPLGPIAGWPAALTATVANMLHTRQPMLLFWGPELVQFYNDSFVPSFGQGKHPAAMGQRARDCWADAWPVIGAQIEAVMSHGEPAWHEDALVPIFRNGRMEEVFWTYSYSPAHDDRGAIVGTLVIVTEMTGRVLAARRLEALARLSFALSNAASHDAAFDALGEIATTCPQDLPFVLVGHAREPRIEKAFGIAPAPAEAVLAAVLATAPASSPQQLVVDVAPPGSVWPEAVRSVMVTAPGVNERVLVLGLSPRLPIDDRYRSYVGQLVEQVASTLARIDVANAARAVQQQRDDLLMRAPVATALMIGPEHVYRLANPLYCKIVGRDPLGKAYLEAFPELRESDLPGILDRVYQTGEPFSVSEMLVPLERGGVGVREDAYFNFNLEPLRDEAEHVYGMMAVAVDVTEQVRSRLALEKIGEERQAVLNALQDALHAKDEFLAMLGHELRNPLAPIVSALEVMAIRPGSDASAHERAVIDRQVRHVIRLVDDLLDISRITKGVIALEKRVVDVAEAVAAAVEMSAQLIGQRGHRLILDAAPGVLVEGDHARLVQVVANLVVNAARYTPEQGEIRIAVRTLGSDAIIEVSDNGTGIDAVLLPTIFEPFVQGTRSADRALGGLGLGLAIVKNLVRLHGGDVTARSDGPGRGSAFLVRLPRAHAAGEAVAPPASAQPATSRRVLVVDDNEDAADLLAEIVRMHGHDVAVVHDPVAALEVIGRFQPEVAVLDIGLPGMDGYQLAERVRAELPGCQLIALTGYGQETDRRRGVVAGFKAHLVKPVRIDALLLALAGP